MRKWQGPIHHQRRTDQHEVHMVEQLLIHLLLPGLPPLLHNHDFSLQESAKHAHAVAGVRDAACVIS